MIFGQFSARRQCLADGAAHVIDFGKLITGTAIEGEKLHHRRGGGHRFIQAGILFAFAIIRRSSGRKQ
ncbi:hypothetical protein D3C80_2169770 [compost metagenome]